MPTPVSEVQRVMDEYRARIFLREAHQMIEMTDRWLMVENALSGRIEALSLQAAELLRQGKPLSKSRLYQMEHYQALLAQARQEVERYSQWSGKQISQEQKKMVALGIESAQNTIRASYLDAGKVGAYFDLLPIEAVDAMIGYGGNGTPLNKLLVQDYPQSAIELTQALIDGTAKGINPRQVARNMSDAMAGNLNRALVIARSEQLRPFRQASRQQMIESGVVEGYIRRCALNLHTCEACLAMDGNEYSTDELMEVHPCDRCFMQPKIKGLIPIQVETGEQWFSRQSESAQREILGAGKFDAWRSGQFEFKQLASRYVDSEWGPSIRVTPLSELIQ